jgi:hypothetical protein
VEKEPRQAFPSGAATQRGLCSSLLAPSNFSEPVKLNATGRKGRSAGTCTPAPQRLAQLHARIPKCLNFAAARFSLAPGPLLRRTKRMHACLFCLLHREIDERAVAEGHTIFDADKVSRPGQIRFAQLQRLHHRRVLLKKVALH